MAKIPGEVVFKPPPAPPKPPKIVVGPQNVNLPTYRPGDVNNPTGPLAPPAPVAPVAPAPPPPPPPPDFNALTLADAQYTTQQNQINQQNQLTLEQLLKGYKGTAQGYQDNANAHGALFSGAAVNAQTQAAQQYADQQRQQALNKQGQDSTNYNNVFQRLIQQLAGGQ